MKLLLPSEVKQGSIGQCILKALKPNSVIPPLMFGLAVEVDHVIGSKWLNNELSRLGFCLSYSEVQRYKQSVLVHKDANNAHIQDSSFTQWVADNVDHNIATLDGKGIFHGMGISSCSIKDGFIPDYQIKRISKMIPKEDIPKGRTVSIHWYHQPNILALSKMVFAPIKHLKLPWTLTDQVNVDVLWQSAALYKRNVMENP